MAEKQLTRQEQADILAAKFAFNDIYSIMLEDIITKLELDVYYKQALFEIPDDGYLYNMIVEHFVNEIGCKHVECYKRDKDIGERMFVLIDFSNLTLENFE